MQLYEKERPREKRRMGGRRVSEGEGDHMTTTKMVVDYRLRINALTVAGFLSGVR